MVLFTRTGTDPEIKKDIKEINDRMQQGDKTRRNYFIIGISCSAFFFILGQLLK